MLNKFLEVFQEKYPDNQCRFYEGAEYILFISFKIMYVAQEIF